MLRLSLLSGVLGATASCLAKFALSPESPLHRIYEMCTDSEGDKTCLIVEWIPRLVCLVAMIIMNALMMGAFLEGMEESGSVAGTGLATAANFGTSALFGIWLWNEQVNEVWLLGFVLVFCGVSLLSQVRSVQGEKKTA
mmetsp:Transcript_12596/g.21001  ORF Transcript_12596/g.21001 Transcript_12596/m.21001 type:complete len:139 (+) Transcript_12596:281-697(+)